jgi:hypothetical protein
MGRAHAVVQWLMHYSASRKVAGSIFAIFFNLPNSSVPGVYSTSNRNVYQKQKNNISGE